MKTTFTFQVDAKVAEDSRSVVNGVIARRAKAGEGTVRKNAGHGIKGLTKSEISELSEKEQKAIAVVNFLLAMEKATAEFAAIAPFAAPVLTTEEKPAKAGKAA